ncbi:hypothetical protein ACIRBY_05450 [Streptomyces sp. NPDC096136]|uniref:hypothetical protein n=1 Tax=Streptomyces sp. NPDC096136 TaxID=3366076 RepID=UPI0037F9F790
MARGSGSGGAERREGRPGPDGKRPDPPSRAPAEADGPEERERTDRAGPGATGDRHEGAVPVTPPPAEPPD